MDFFKSVFSEDPSPPLTSSDQRSDEDPASPSTERPDSKPVFPNIPNAWASLGSSFLKTVATKSESVLGGYRRDLEEFSSGLRKETAIIRDAAGKAVRELPGRLESGAAVAQSSLESVGQVIDNLGDAVSGIIIHGKDSIFNFEDHDSEADLEEIENTRGQSDSGEVKPYSRLDASIRAIQCDLRTYCEDPEDAADFMEWKKGFSLEDLGGEIEALVTENGAVGEIYEEVVPGKVDRETFWSRYFYRSHKIRKAEEARMRLVQRAIEGEDEEELSWDFDGDDGRPIVVDSKLAEKEVEDSEKLVEGSRPVEAKELDDASELRAENEYGGDQSGTIGMPDENEWNGGKLELEMEKSDSNGEKLEPRLDVRSSSEGKNGNFSDFSVISSQPSEVEDVGWDEIEEGIASGEETKPVAQTGQHRSVDLRKRLSAAEEDEDLSWDIEDDDEEQAKS